MRDLRGFGLYTCQKLCPDFEPLLEQHFHSNTAHNDSQRKLGSVVELAYPVLCFVSGLDRFRYLVSDQQAELKADVVSREDLLTGHEQGRFA
jgi:hypothetical protein